ncbi:hypothetical protein O1L55_09515 [Streptomyces albulus]|nr:hypothetical protein [Streptomyces noursei]
MPVHQAPPVLVAHPHRGVGDVAQFGDGGGEGVLRRSRPTTWWTNLGFSSRTLRANPATAS